MDYSDDNFEAFSGSASIDNREPCGKCGRKFNPDALTRHMPICAKSKPRKVFNVAKQRAEGTDIESFNKQQPRRKQQQSAVASRQHQTDKPIPVKKSNWRATHEDFINTIRAAKQVSICQEKGLPLPPPPPPSLNPDYISCEYCDRRFNQKAAERHIPFCKEQHSRLPRNKPDANAKKKRETQLNYRAPRLKGTATTPNSLAVGGGSYGSRSAGTIKSPTSPGNSGARRPVNNPRAGIKPSSSTHNGTSRYDMDSPDSGRPLRTGRTQETYSEARELSAKQRSTMSVKKSPASRYGGGSPSSTAPRYHGNPESGYNSNASEESYSTPTGRLGSAARFCHDCGTKYPIATAKFCCECGVRRMNVF